MPHRQDFNVKFPENTRSSSSVSLNESPITDDINYDSDISEDDDHAIAEGEDDDEEEEEEEADEGFEVEVSTLTGNTFSVMIQPQDTVEVLKTRIAFQEGISPADQNLVMEQGQGKLLDTNSTLEELNICRNFNNKLTLVTNVNSGVPFKNHNSEDNGNGIERQHLWDTSPPDRGHRLAPTVIRRNNLDLPQDTSATTATTTTTSLRLPKILAGNSNGNNNINNNSHSDTSHVNYINPLGLENENSWRRKYAEENENDSLPDQLQREWMQSLFNKKANAEEERIELEANGGVDDDDDDDDDYDIDSTTGRMDSTIISSQTQTQTRYGRKSRSQLPNGEEDSNILVVQGDDGVILIIQKNSGVLEDSKNDNVSIELGVHPGRIIPEMRRRGRRGSEQSKSHSQTQVQSQSVQSVQERIKENAVTLEKMRQVRTLMAQKKTETPEKKSGVEFPKISAGSSTASSIKHNTLAVPGSGTGNRRSSNANIKNGGCNSNRSINSSKMSLNRLIAEIYLQSKRKGYSFQPGQPPYTEQQLLKYVQLKVAILLDEQKKNKTEPCSKCITSSDWNFSETKPYLMPTVVMNRYKRLSNTSRSLDKEIEQEEELPKPLERRKSTIMDALNFVDKDRKRSQIPRLVPGSNNTATATASTASTTTLSRRSSSSVPNGIGGGIIPPIGDRGRSVTNQYIIFNGMDNGIINDLDLDCDIGSDNGNGRQSISFGGNRRPSFKVNQKVYTVTTATASSGGTSGIGRAVGVGYTSKKSSRPGSSGKVGAGKPKKPAAVRCPVCKKKIAIANRYQCRCGLTFCPVHRYPESHECTFDYKTEGRNKIREANPVIVAKKITEI